MMSMMENMMSGMGGGGGDDARRDESRGDDAGHAGDVGRREVRAAYFFCYAGGA